jgi:hypothetical protein
MFVLHNGIALEKGVVKKAVREFPQKLSAETFRRDFPQRLSVAVASA